jgi:hypothetical protein
MKISCRENYPFQGVFPPALQLLHIENCQLRKFDPRWNRLKHLTVLHLTDNRLQSVGVLILDKLTNLCELNVSHNELTEWPLVPTQLSILDVSHNSLIDIPTRFFEHCHRLQQLDASYNQLTVLPQSVCLRAHTLRTLRLQYNRLHILPHAITQLSLQTLDLSDQQVFRDESMMDMDNDLKQPISLFGLTAAAVHNHSLATYPLPWSIRLDVECSDMPRCAVCRSVCPLECTPVRSVNVRLRNIASTIITNNDTSATMPSWLYCCAKQLCSRRLANYNL